MLWKHPSKHQRHNMPSSSERLECRHLDLMYQLQMAELWVPSVSAGDSWCSPSPPKGAPTPWTKFVLQKWPTRCKDFATNMLLHSCHEWISERVTPNGPLCLVFTLVFGFWSFLTRGGELILMHHFQLIKESQRLVTVTVVLKRTSTDL